MEHDPAFMSASSVAARLGLPKSWIKSEAVAGRLPCLRIGRRMLFNPDAIEIALSARAAGKRGAVNTGKAVRHARA